MGAQAPDRCYALIGRFELRRRRLCWIGQRDGLLGAVRLPTDHFLQGISITDGPALPGCYARCSPTQTRIQTRER